MTNNSIVYLQSAPATTTSSKTIRLIIVLQNCKIKLLNESGALTLLHILPVLSLSLDLTISIHQCYIVTWNIDYKQC